MQEEINEMALPLKPTKEEKIWIRNSYNWGGLTVVFQFLFINVICSIVIGVATFIVMGKNDSVATQKFLDSLNGMCFTVALANLIGAVIAYPLSILIGCKGLKIKLKSFFSTKGYTVKFVLCAIVVGLGVQFLGSSLATLITSLADKAGVTLTTLDTSIKPDMATNVIMYILTCISAPIFEEILFRGLIMRAFSKVSVKFGIIASAAMFGLYHQNIPQAVNAFFLGLLLGYVAYKAGSIIPCMIIHLAMNLNGMVWSNISDVFGDSNKIVNTASVLWTALIIVGSISIVFLNRQKLFLPKESVQNKKRTVSLLFTSWAVLLAIAILVAVTIFASIQF